MIDLLDLERKKKNNELSIINIREEINNLPEERGHYSITRSGKRKYDMSQEALFENLLKYGYNSLRRLGAERDLQPSGVMGGSVGDLAMLTTTEGIEKVKKRNDDLRKHVLSQTSFYKSEVRKYRDLLNEEIERDPSTIQRFVAGMGVHMLRQYIDPNQWVMLSATSGIGGVVGGKTAGFLGGKVSTTTAKRIGAFTTRAVNEGIEEAIDQYTVDEELNAGGILSAAAAGGAIGEVPFLAKYLAGKAGLIKAPGKATPNTNINTKTLKQKTEADYTSKVAETKNTNRVDVDNIADIAEAVEIQGEIKGKDISAKDTFLNSILIEGVTTEEAANEYLPKIAKHIIDNKIVKGIIDEESFFEAVKTNGKSIKNAFRTLERRKDLPDDLKTAIKWYNTVMDEARIKSVEVDLNKAIKNSIDVLDNPSEYKPIWRVPEEEINHQANPVLHEREIHYSAIANYAVDNNLIKGINSTEEFLDGIKNNTRAIRKFFRNIERRKDLPDDVKESIEWYKKPEIERRKKFDLEGRTEVERYSPIDNKPSNRANDYNPTKPWDNFKTDVETTGREYTAHGIDNPRIKAEPQKIEEEYPFVLEEVNGTKYEEVKKERIAHNPRDYTKKQLEKELRKDLNIPKNAKIINCNGGIPKTKVPIITGKDYDGNAVTGRNKWIRHTPEADIEWEHKGEKYFAKVLIVDGKWRGDIYKHNPKTVYIPRVEKSTKPYSKKPDNIMEDIYGKYEPDEKITTEFKEFKEKLYKFLGLDKLNLDATPKEKADLQRKIAKVFGNFVKNKHNFKNIDEMLEYYKNKKGINFELEIIPKKEGMLGETKLYATADGNKVKISITKEAMEDLDLALGILRHEIEHATDFIKNPDFDGRPYHWLTPEKDMTIADYFNASTGGHFSTDNNSMYELNYIAANLMNNIVHKGKLNKEVIKRLGFDMIPENPTDFELKMIQSAVAEGQGEADAIKRLAKLKKDLSNFFTMRRGLIGIATSNYSVKNKAEMMKEYLKTNLILPFEKKENQMYNYIVKAFEIEHDGTKYNINEILNLFEASNADFVNWCFYWDKLPEGFERIEPQLVQLKATLNQIVDSLAEGTGITRMDIINSLNFDRNYTIESLIPKEEIAKFVKDGRLDTEKLFLDDKIIDEVTGSTGSKRFFMYRDRFAELNYGYFNSAKDILKFELERPEIDSKRVIKCLKEARDCMTLEEFTNLLRKYNVQDIAEINDYLLKHQEFFAQKTTLLGEEEGIEKAIIESKKKTAKKFFTMDMESIKGTSKNPALGGHLHRLGRFVYAREKGLISKGNISEFVKVNHVDSRLMLDKFLRDISASYAIKETMPAEGWNGFKAVLNSVSESIVDSDKKTFLQDVEGYVEAEIGEKLGRITYPPKGTLDKVITNFLSTMNRINLIGPKFLKELLQEPLGISENNIMLYGGKGVTNTYGDMLKATTILIENGERLKRINKVLGDRFHKSVSTEAFNIIRKDLDDVTGYYAKRRAIYGTKAEKIAHSLKTGTELFNGYAYTQTVMKLASNFGAGHILETWTKFSSLEKLFSENTHYIKRLFRDLEIDDIDFALLKEFTETETFKTLGIFDEVEFEKSLNPEMYSKLLERGILPEEFEVLKKSTVKKISNLNDRIASDISPTEATKGARVEVERIKDPVLRNFVKLIGNFKASIQEIWRRKHRAYYLANVDPDTGKYDFSNVVYKKRLLKNILNKGAFLAAVATVSDAEFYDDPQEFISEKIDELLEAPASPIWAAVQEDLNLWGLTTGANSLRQPVAVIDNATKGKWDKASRALMKMGVGTANYNMGEKAYKYLFDD